PEDNIPPSFRVVPRHAEEVDLIGERFKDRPGVQPPPNGVVYARDTIKALLSITNLVQLLLWVVAGGLLLAATLLILNTIRTAIFARRREVEVMKLVGASNWFIRVPFMVEGLVQGVVGAAGAFAAIYFLSGPLGSWIRRRFGQLAGFHVDAGDVLLGGVLLL